MIVYAESSAVLTWLLGEREEATIRGILADAERVVSSTLTEIECARALRRAVAAGRLGDADRLAALKVLDEASRSWVVLELTDRLTERAKSRFPQEPIRTLDALHLAAALWVRGFYEAVSVLSLDQRVRSNAAALRFPVVP